MKARIMLKKWCSSLIHNIPKSRYEYFVVDLAKPGAAIQKLLCLIKMIVHLINKLRLKAEIPKKLLDAPKNMPDNPKIDA